MVNGKTVGLIGTNWGRIYPWIFRELGFEIDILMGRDLKKTQETAIAEGISKFTTQARDLDHVDILILAVPVEFHGEYLKRFPGKFILCEKALFGRHIPSSPQAMDHTRIYVNYAFPLLQSAKLMKALLKNGEIGTPKSLTLQVRYNLPDVRSVIEKFADTAVHEIYFLQTLFAAFKIKDGNFYYPGDSFRALMHNEQDLPLDVSFDLLSEQGIEVEIQIHTTGGTVLLRGGYRPGKFWNFDPIMFNNHPVNPGEYSLDGNDVWVQANKANVELFLKVVNGILTPEKAREEGLSNYHDALQVDMGLISIVAGCP